MDENEIKLRYPLHYFVWCNNKEGLAQYLSRTTSSKIELEQKDPRGRTALMLAVTLGRKACTSILIKHNAQIDTDDSKGFTALQEVLADGNKKFYRYLQRKFDCQLVGNLINELFQSIASAEDFYVEIELDFSTWVPFVGCFLPNDKITVYKRGSQIRIDNILVVNDDYASRACAPWKRGHNSMIARVNESGVSYCDIDHCKKEIYEFKYTTNDINVPSDEDIREARHSAIHAIRLHVDKIQVESARARGVLNMFHSERLEVVSNYQCKLYSVTNVQVSHHSRVDHMPAHRKQRVESAPINAFLSMLGINSSRVHHPAKQTDAPKVEEHGSAAPNRVPSAKRNPNSLTLHEYFSPAVKPHDIGRARELIVRSKCSKGQLWMAEQFPLSVSSHLVPILKLLSIYNPYYKCILSFITSKMPAGFPVKLEVSIVQMLSARVTFDNVFASKQAVPGVHYVTQNGGGVPSCTIDQYLFDLPQDYSTHSV